MRSTTLSAEQKVVAAQMFNHLVTPSGMKIAHGSRDLAGYTGVTEAELATVLDAARARERILRPVAATAASPRYEIFHDVLADAVLAWRVEFEARAAVAREQRGGARRHRRLLIIVGIALARARGHGRDDDLALSQRDQAQKNEAIAQSAQSDAQTQADKATRRRHGGRHRARRSRRTRERAKAAESGAEREREGRKAAGARPGGR